MTLKKSYGKIADIYINLVMVLVFVLFIVGVWVKLSVTSRHVCREKRLSMTIQIALIMSDFLYIRLTKSIKDPGK
jgi:hypothetical protein